MSDLGYGGISNTVSHVQSGNISGLTHAQIRGINESTDNNTTQQEPPSPTATEPSNPQTQEPTTDSSEPQANPTITAPKAFKKKFADKIINFNPSSDNLEIDLKSFGLEETASFRVAKSKKAIKKSLSRKEFDFLYDQKKGGLYYNQNGAEKGFGEGGIVAILKGSPDISNENILFF